MNARIEAIDWAQVGEELDAQGSATIAGLVAPDECRALAAMYADEPRFRSRVVMGRHGFGRGEYKYFSYPLPAFVARLRTALYPRLVPIANRWHAAMGVESQFPDCHAAFIERCHADGQTRPTPLLLQYGEGDYKSWCRQL